MDDSSRRVSRDATSCSGTGSQTATESISCGIDRDYSLRGRDVEDRLSGQALWLRWRPARSLRSRGGRRRPPLHTFATLLRVDYFAAVSDSLWLRVRWPPRTLAALAGRTKASAPTHAF